MPFSLSSALPLALHAEGCFGEPMAKMSYGILRYSPNPVACIVDSRFAGQTLLEAFPRLQPDHRPPVPFVASAQEAAELEAKAFVLGTAPPGGRIPADWYGALDEAVGLGLGIVNGMHERLAPRYPAAKSFVWDVRQEPEGLSPGTGAAAALPGRRVLMVGTDMAVGKMTAGLELWRSARAAGVDARFVATGQVGMIITGSGVPLDAVRVDYASGAIEAAVVSQADGELSVVEGQGALNHPGSTSPLPLLRGACPTHLILCCRAGQLGLRSYPELVIPPLRELGGLYERLASCAGLFPAARVCAVAVNTFHISDEAEAAAAVARIAVETGLPACDPVRQGAAVLLEAVG